MQRVQVILSTVVSICLQVTDIWYEHLSRLLRQRTKTPAKPSGIGPAFNSGLPTDFEILGKFFVVLIKSLQVNHICSVEETALYGVQVRLGPVCRIALWECLGNSLVLLATKRLHRTTNRAKIRLLKQSYSAIRHNTDPVLIATSQLPNDGGLGLKIRRYDAWGSTSQRVRNFFCGNKLSKICDLEISVKFIR